MNPKVLAEMRLDYQECENVFNKIRSGEMNFHEFFDDFLDNMRNEEFDSGYSYALDNVEVYIKEAEGDIDYVSFLIHKERNSLSGKVDSV